MFNDFLGPVHSGSTNDEKSTWEPKLMVSFSFEMLSSYLLTLSLQQGILKNLLQKSRWYVGSSNLPITNNIINN